VSSRHPGVHPSAHPSAQSPRAGGPGAPRLRIGVLYSRVRVEEKLLFEAVERRGVDLDLLDDQTSSITPTGITTSSSSAASITAARSTA
jgi:hypothetical protein